MQKEDIVDRKLIGICGAFKTGITKIINYGVTPAFFLEPYQPLISEMFEYYKKYFELITPDALTQILIDKHKDQSTITATVATLEDILADPDVVHDASVISELDFFIDRIRKRTAIKICEETSQKLASAVIASKVETARELMTKAIVNVDKVLNSNDIREGTLSDFIDFRIERYRDRKENPEKYRGIQSGFPVLDKTTDGFQPGDLIIYCAESGGGKSANLLHSAFSAWLEKYPGAGRGANVVLFTIEMDWNMYLRRFDARHASLDSIKLKSSNLDDSEYNQWIACLGVQKNKDNLFYVVDIPSGCSTLYIRNKLDEIRMKYPDHPIELVVIDYLGIMTPSQDIDGSDWIKQGVISQECKELARAEKVPVLTAVQETRDATKDTKMGGKTTAIVARSQMIVANTNIIIYIKPDQKKDDDEKMSLFKNYNESANILYYQTLKSRDGQKVEWKSTALFDKMLIQPLVNESETPVEENLPEPINEKQNTTTDEETFEDYYTLDENADDTDMSYAD